MKNLKSLLLFVLITSSVQATAAQYVIIKQGLWGSFKLIYVDKPKNLARWHYDSKHDTYYHGQTYWGLALPVFFKNKVDQSQYVYVKPCFCWGIKLVSTHEPQDTKKWQYDAKTNAYYRGRNAWGFDCGADIKDKTKA